MAKRETAGDQITRILQMLPLAARAEGASPNELARALGTDERTVLRDLAEVYTRAYYHPAGSGEDTQILLEQDRVTVWTTGEFRRPARLNTAEAAALGLGLRLLAAESDDTERQRLLDVARRLEAQLAHEEPRDWLAHHAVNSGAPDSGGVRARLEHAARERTPCRIRYLKQGAAQPEERRVHPYLLALAEGHAYLLAHCHAAGAVRIFRLDRIHAVEAEPGTFTVPPDFDPAAFLAGGRVFRADEPVPVRVRYSARIARWIAEHGPVEPQPDGSVHVVHPVADPDWIVRHVLQYGADAEVLDPPEIRQRIRERVRAMRR